MRNLLVLLVLAAPLAWAGGPDDEVRQKLESILLDMSLADAPLPAFIAHFREATHLNILLDQHSVQDPEAILLTLALKQVRADHVLAWALYGRNLEYTIRDGVILISGTGSGSSHAEELRLYDVADLLAQPRDFPSAESEQTAAITMDDLSTLLKDLVEPGIWDTPPNSMVATAGGLVVVARPEVLSKVEYVLSAMRYLANFTVTFDARVVDLAPGALDGAPTLGSLASGRIVLTKDEAASILVPREGSERVLEAIRFTCANSQRTHVRLSRTEESLHGALAGGETSVRTAAHESVLDVRPILAVGRDAVLVDLDATIADPSSPPDRLQTPKGTIDLARGGVRRVRTSFSVPNGGGALLVLGVSGDRVRALFLRVASNAQPPSVTPVAGEKEAPPAASPADRAWAAFQQGTMDVDVEGMKLPAFLEYLQGKSGVSCVLDPVCVQEDNAADATVSFHAHDLRGKDVLSLVTQMLGIGYVYREEAILFTRPERVESSVIRVYDARDLMWTKQDYPGPVFEAGMEAGAGPATAVFEMGGGGVAEEIVSTIRANIAAGSWDERPDQARIVQMSGALFVLQRPSVHDKIRELLETMRAQPPRQVQIDARVIELDPAVHDTLDAGGGGALPAASAKEIEQAILAKKARVTAAWSILGLNGQRFHSTLIFDREYVDDYDIDKETGAMDPVYKTLRWGHAIDLRPTLVSAEAGRLNVELQVQCCDAPDALPAEKSGDITVQVPRVDRGDVHTTVFAEEGKTLLFTLGNAAGEGGERRRVLVWTVREAK